MAKKDLKGHTYSDGKNTWSVWDLICHSQKFPVVDLDVGDLFECFSRCKIAKTWNCVTFRDLVDHIDRIQDADLSYPILLDPEGDVADGVHRVMKAYMAGHKTIKGIHLESMPEPLKLLLEQYNHARLRLFKENSKQP